MLQKGLLLGFHLVFGLSLLLFVGGSVLQGGELSSTDSFQLFIWHCLFALIFPEFRDYLDYFFCEVFADFLKDFSSFGRHASSLGSGGLDESCGFELLQDFSDVASSSLGGVVGSDAETFSSAVVATEFFESDGTVYVDFAE